MDPLLKTFKAEFTERVLLLLWRQWGALGVLGSQPVWGGPVIDPDALLIFSLHTARYDARLFQEVLDWLTLNGGLINIQRLNNMVRRHGFAGARTLPPVAALLAENSSQQLKWKRLAEGPSGSGGEPLFFLLDGRPMPVPHRRDERFVRYGFETQPLELRGYSRSFNPALSANRLLMYRAFFGVNSRSELLCLLGSGHGVTAAEAARLTGYSARSVQNVLAEMAASGWVDSREGGRDKTYSFHREPRLAALFNLEESSGGWIFWPAVFQTLEAVWLKLFSRDFDSLDSLSLDSEFFLLWKECRKFLALGVCGDFQIPAPGRTLEGAAEGFVVALLNALRQLEK